MLRTRAYVSCFLTDRKTLASKVSIQTDTKKYNFSTFCEHDKSKTMIAIILKQRQKVAHICKVVPNKF